MALQMPELLMLIGLPGSGKSTWAKKRIAQDKNKNYHYLSLDEILEEFAQRDGITYAESFEKYAGFAAKLLDAKAKKAFAQQINVIWDQTNMSVKTRKSKLKLAENYEKTAVVFIIPEPELKRRVAERAKTTGKVIPDFVIKNMANKYEAPSKEEGFNKIITIRG